MQPSSKEMQGMAAFQELQNGVGASQDDFLDQMMSGFAPTWAHGLVNPKSVCGAGLAGKSPADEGIRYASYDESSLLAAGIRQHQAAGGGSSPTEPSMLLRLGHRGHHQAQKQMFLQSMGQPPTAGGGDDAGGFLPLPLSLGPGGSGDSGMLADGSFKSLNPTEAEALYNNGFGGSLQRAAQAPANQQLLHHTQSYGGAPATAAGMGQAPTTAPAGAGGGTAPPRPRVRARRGQATDPHSIAERLRRERIAERMKALQELVPNANKTDKASMLDEIIDYVKFLQLQVKVLSMSRLGGAAAIAPLAANMSTEVYIDHRIRSSMLNLILIIAFVMFLSVVSTWWQSGAGRAGGAPGDDSLTAAEQQVAKLLDEDMGSAMQYLQGKGLCLMPISLASAISSATCRPRPSGLAQLNLRHAAPGDAPPSPSMSALTVQSSSGAGSVDADISRPSAGCKDGASVP